MVTLNDNIFCGDNECWKEPDVYILPQRRQILVLFLYLLVE